MISIFKCSILRSKRIKKIGLPGTNTHHSKYLYKTMYQEYFLTVLELNGVLVGVKLKKGLGAGSFAFDETCVNGAGGLKF